MIDAIKKLEPIQILVLTALATLGIIITVGSLSMAPDILRNAQDSANNPTPSMTCIAGCAAIGPLGQLLGGPPPPPNYDPNASMRVFRDSATHSLCYQTFSSGFFSSGSSMTCVPEKEAGK